MEVTLLSVLALGFILGIKHAIEPDHVIAVSTIASQSKKLWNASFAGVFWGIGAYCNIIYHRYYSYSYEGRNPEKWAMSLEFLVGIMLVYLGVKTILSFKNIHIHNHQYDGDDHMTCPFPSK